MSQKFRRLGAATLAATVAAASLAGCAPEAQTSAPDDADYSGPINVFLVGNPTGNAIEQMIDKYNDEFGTNVVATILPVAQQRSRTLLNLQYKSANMDAFMSLPNREGPQFAAADYYVPLDDYFAEIDDSYKLDEIGAGVVKAMEVDGVTYAVPLSFEGPVMYYRKDLFTKLGLTVPTTISELVAVVKSIADSGEDVVPITLRGDADTMVYTFGPFLHANGAEWATDGKPDFDSDEAVTAIEQYAELAGTYGPPGVVNYTWRESTNLFASGKAAIELEASALYSTIKDPKTSSVVDVTGIANFPGGIPALSGWGLAMSSFSNHKAATWKFMEWITSPETQLQLALLGDTPLRPSVLESPEYTATLTLDSDKEWVQALGFIAENGNPEVGPMGEQSAQMRTIIGTEVGKAILGSASPKDAAAAIQQGLTPLLKK